MAGVRDRAPGDAAADGEEAGVSGVDERAPGDGPDRYGGRDMA